MLTSSKHKVTSNISCSGHTSLFLIYATIIAVLHIQLYQSVLFVHNQVEKSDVSVHLGCYSQTFVARTIRHRNVSYVRYDQRGHRNVTVYISIHGCIQCFYL